MMGTDWYARGEKEGRSTPGPWRWEDRGGSAAELMSDSGSVLWAEADNVRIDDAALIEAAPDMLALLRWMEWEGNGAVSECPVCREARPTHRGSCSLAAILARFPETT